MKFKDFTLCAMVAFFTVTCAANKDYIKPDSVKVYTGFTFFSDSGTPYFSGWVDNRPAKILLYSKDRVKIYIDQIGTDLSDSIYVSSEGIIRSNKYKNPEEIYQSVMDQLPK